MEWRTIVAFPDYAISENGQIKRLTPGCGTWPGRVLNHAVSRGYAHVSLRRDKETYNVRVHVLLCEAFHGPRPTLLHDAAHNNGTQLDNRSDNVRWATKSDNQIDRICHGTDIRGSAVYGAKLTERDVARIKRRLAQGARQIDLARAYDVSASTIHLISNGTTWRHVT